SGGALGAVLASILEPSFGFTGSTLLLLAVIAGGLSLFTGISWLRVAESAGIGAEWVYSFAESRIEARRDREEGRIAAQVREERVEEAKHALEEHEPIRIEMPAVVIQKSERVAREKQAPLFADMPDSSLPQLSLLDQPESHFERPTSETLEYTSRLIERKLLDFNVQVKVVAAYPGPVITRYEIEPAVGVKGSQIVNLARDLARALAVTAIRVVETIPGSSCMGLEIPNPKREIVRLAEIVGSQQYADTHSKLTLALGKDITGKPVVVDLAKMPHLLVAGTTGSGKSVAINAMILSLLYKATPGEVRLIFIDPKMLELSVYEGIPHLLAPVVTDMRQASSALHWCVAEMERRYKLMSAFSVRNLASYTQKVREAIEKKEPLKHPFTLTPEDPELLEPLPLLVVVIDELADLMMVSGKKVEELIARLAQKSRACGIHLILATQRPSVDVITGLIKANVPTRIAFQVSAKVDSRTILDQQGAESLLGQGDMLFLTPGHGIPTRVHGAYVADAEVHRVVESLKKQGEAQYIDGILDEPEQQELNANAEGSATGEADPLYDQAVQIVLQNKRASISLVQRHLRIGYNRAARLVEDMEKAGLVTPMASNGNREIIQPSR
ncbi:MAG TPA: DNA translocase FtsK 4TM domain-containing protein, partial [Usitatibacter sp.]|nr:DNA translocase FtsK 4TM domain-containing protein [Usitatibacter sp.]